MTIFLAILVAIVVLAVFGALAVKALLWVAIALFVLWLIGVAMRGTDFRAGRRV